MTAPTDPRLDGYVERSLRPRFSKGYTISPSGCWDWIGAKRGKGRSRGYLYDRRVGGHAVATRISWELRYGVPVPGDLLVCHHCDNPGCVNPEHLFIGTAFDNMRDAYDKGRLLMPDQYGEKNSHAKLTAQEVHDIRRMASDGYKNAELRRIFGLSKSAMGHVIAGRRWQREETKP